MAKEKTSQTYTLDEAVETLEIGVRLGKELVEMLRFPINHARLDGLFDDMKNSKYKPAFEKILQKIYQTPDSSPNWERTKNIIESYMKEHGFEVPK